MEIKFSPCSLFAVLLTVVFVVLKLCGVIAWSWWWIFAPMWIPLVIALVIWFIWFIMFIVGLIAVAVSEE